MKKLFAFFLILTLTACGWHLRGATNIPKELSQLYITAIDSQGALITELRQLLKTNHISLVDNSDIANYSLKILEEKKDKRTAGVGNDALSSAYEITLKAEFEIRAKNSNAVNKGSAVSVRSFNYSTASINSAAQEEVLLEKEMRRDLAQQMLLYLSAVITHPPGDDEKVDPEKLNNTQHKKEQPNGKTAP